MSKSSGEFLTVSLLEEKGYDPLDYRFFCLQSHYRKMLVFTWENLDNARGAYQKLVKRIAALRPDDGTVDEDVVKAFREKFVGVMGNDLNTASGLSMLYDALKANANDATKLAVIGSFDEVLSLSLLDKAEALRRKERESASASHGGYTITSESGADADIEALILARYEAKKAKNFAEADRIRDELRQQGVEITDVPGGAVWKRA